MPLTLSFTEGVLPQDAINQVIEKLTDSMLAWHGLTGNKIMTPTVTAQVHALPKGATFTGGKALSGVWVEWKVPAFAFATRKIQMGHIEEATNIVYEAADGKLPKNQIWVNVVHAVDGAWGIAGQAMSNEDILAAIATG
jgi:hypothetical protein